MKTQVVFNVGGKGAKARHGEISGVDHLVVPTVAMVSGVLNGSAGPILYEDVDIEKAVSVWNHRPLVVYHPKLTANDPIVLTSRGVGLTLNAEFVEGKLKMESWIDIAKCKKVDNRVLERLEANLPVEVSTGLDIDFEEKAGVHNSTEYNGIARHHRPDHLAILPDQIGASSVAQGAGLLQNSGTLTRPHVEGIELQALMALGGLTKVLNLSTVHNEKSFQEITCDLYSLLHARWGYNLSIVAVHDEFVVYMLEYDNKRMFKVGYSKTDKEVTLASEPVEVYRSVSYVTVSNGAVVATVTNQVKESVMKKSEMVAMLITNGGYEEADRPMLEGWTEEKLAKVVGKVKNEASPSTPATPPSNTPATTPILNGAGTTGTTAPNTPVRQLTEQEFLQFAPPSVAAMIRNANAVVDSEKTRLIAVITAHNTALNADFLKTQELDLLRGIAAPFMGPSDFVNGPNGAPILNMTGAGGSPFNVQNAGEETECLALPGPSYDKR
jgi:hypothetical protein